MQSERPVPFAMRNVLCSAITTWLKTNDLVIVYDGSDHKVEELWVPPERFKGLRRNFLFIRMIPLTPQSYPGCCRTVSMRDIFLWQLVKRIDDERIYTFYQAAGGKYRDV